MYVHTKTQKTQIGEYPVSRECRQHKTAKIQRTVLQQLSTLKTLEMDALHDKWNELFGTEPPKYKKHFLVRRLAWRIQEMYFGGLSEATEAALASLVAKDPVATTRTIPAQTVTKTAPVLGTRFVRVWKGEQHTVEVHESGFIFRGRPYRSLSAVAKEITGTKWKGNVFFGLKKAGRADGR